MEFYTFAIDKEWSTPTSPLQYQDIVKQTGERLKHVL